MERKIKDYLNEEKTCLAVDAASSVFDAVKTYVSGNINHVLIQKNGEIVGIFTENDLSKRIVAAGKDPKTTKIAEVMTADPIAVDWNTDVDSCMFMMIKNNFRHLLVRDNKGSMCAVVSAKDLLKAKVQEVSDLLEAENIFSSNKLIDQDEDTIAKNLNQYKS